ncbi:MAG: tRNA (N6-isopentenyl adenosine(37)-C2)-methylthiotransferase MiaB [Desulfobacterales bacterium]|nr:tRNA (N6-isopentenyl adenosine(37)-C2)-methylthiotransferase MiaB [Desulfobacterales bacterium]
MSQKNVYIYTMGCQMNVYDSEQMFRILLPLGYQETSHLSKADLIIVNTCSIRDKAEQKAYSFLGRLVHYKRKKSGLIIAVGGCVAQQKKHHLLERMPHVDLVFGTHTLHRLPEWIRNIEQKNRSHGVDVEMSDQIHEIQRCGIPFDPTHQKISAYVTIMRGCDNYCSYCIVPYVRGSEVSREPSYIIEEIRQLVSNGVREVTLLGQNVNSYGKKQGLCSFSELLALVNQIDGLCRIRFATSHPKDFSDDVIQAFRNNEKLCSHLHLPVQSGSNHVLSMMNRKYTREDYLKKIETLKQYCPDIACTTDIIVGFPGETVSDFKETLDLIQTVQFDGLFAFMYSDRPLAKSSSLNHKLSEEEKNDRLKELLEIQSHNTIKKNLDEVGKTVEILVEGKSKKNHIRENCEIVEWTGRSSSNKIVNFVKSSADHNIIGQQVNVMIQKACAHSLWGEVV